MPKNCYIFKDKYNLDEKSMLKKLDNFLMEKFPHIILAFTFFWLALVAYGLLNA